MAANTHTWHKIGQQDGRRPAPKPPGKGRPPGALCKKTIYRNLQKQLAELYINVSNFLFFSAPIGDPRQDRKAIKSWRGLSAWEREQVKDFIDNYGRGKGHTIDFLTEKARPTGQDIRQIRAELDGAIEATGKKPTPIVVKRRKRRVATIEPKKPGTVFYRAKVFYD